MLEAHREDRYSQDPDQGPVLCLGQDLDPGRRQGPDQDPDLDLGPDPDLDRGLDLDQDQGQGHVPDLDRGQEVGYVPTLVLFVNVSFIHHFLHLVFSHFLFTAKFR